MGKHFLYGNAFSALHTNINCSAFQSTCMMGVYYCTTRTTTTWATGNLTTLSHVVTLPSGFRDRGMECDHSTRELRYTQIKCGNVFWLLKDTVWLLLIWYRWPGAPGWGWNPERWADGGSHALQSKAEGRNECVKCCIIFNGSGIHWKHVQLTFERHHTVSKSVPK